MTHKTTYSSLKNIQKKDVRERKAAFPSAFFHELREHIMTVFLFYSFHENKLNGLFFLWSAQKISEMH